MARKGDLKPIRNLTIALDQRLSEDLERVALRDERCLTEQARYYIRQGIKADATPAEDTAGVSV